jgi:hypothetical protein
MIGEHPIKQILLDGQAYSLELPLGWLITTLRSQL